MADRPTAHTPQTVDEVFDISAAFAFRPIKCPHKTELTVSAHHSTTKNPRAHMEQQPALHTFPPDQLSTPAVASPHTPSVKLAARLDSSDRTTPVTTHGAPPTCVFSSPTGSRLGPFGSRVQHSASVKRVATPTKKNLNTQSGAAPKRAPIFAREEQSTTESGLRYYGVSWSAAAWANSSRRPRTWSAAWGGRSASAGPGGPDHGRGTARRACAPRAPRPESGPSRGTGRRSRSAPTCCNRQAGRPSV